MDSNLGTFDGSHKAENRNVLVVFVRGQVERLDVLHKANMI